MDFFSFGSLGPYACKFSIKDFEKAESMVSYVAI